MRSRERHSLEEGDLEDVVDLATRKEPSEVGADGGTVGPVGLFEGDFVIAGDAPADRVNAGDHRELRVRAMTGVTRSMAPGP